MAGSQAQGAFRHPAYRRWITLRLWQCGLCARVAAFGLLAGACSYQLNTDTAKKADDVTTGSVAARQAQASVLPASAGQAEAAQIPAEGDLVFARAAVSEVLSRGGKDASVPWENPATGARGTVTPIAQAYNQDGRICRDFLASYIKPGAESWLQGEACRQAKGKWEVRSLKPWKRAGPA